jgi:hypothetical protein
VTIPIMACTSTIPTGSTCNLSSKMRDQTRFPGRWTHGSWVLNVHADRREGHEYERMRILQPGYGLEFRFL